MKGFDVKSGVIGALSAACVLLAMGAGQQAAQRYQISAANGSIIALDHQTGTVTILNSERRNNETTWVADSQFSLQSAIESANGAAAKAGPSHRP